MSIFNLIMALALVAVLWRAIVKALAASIRRGEPVQLTELLSARPVTRRSPPPNRLLPMPPTRTGPSNVNTDVDISAMRDLRA